MILACLLLVGSPRFELIGLAPDIAAAAQKHYETLVSTIEAVSGKPITRSDRTIVIEEAKDMRAWDAGVSSLGRIRIRAQAVALPHELAHQVLLLHCPQASADKLFHEAFALATSGELDAWIGEGYFSSVKAEKILHTVPSLDSRDARQALARLIADGRAGGPVPVAVAKRLSACFSGAPWQAMRVEELSQAAAPASGDAFIVLSRHSGEELQSVGEVKLLMPFGSVLKPLVVAGALGAPPVLPVDTRDPLWRCGDNLPAEMAVAAALQRSCNAYFLQWGKRAPELAHFGAYGDVLLGLGLERLPEHIDEAIGLRPTLALSAWQVAQAYRVLAAARPDILAMLSATAEIGTLSGLDASKALAAYALKTGTVRDPRNNVELGWIVAIAPDFVAVMAQKGSMPRAFASRFAARLAQIPKTALLAPARVQVFGLLDAGDVLLDCSGIPVSVREQQPVVGRRGNVPLSQLRGVALCLGQPFRVRFAGIAPRPYAGTFLPSQGPKPVAGEPKARRGSDFIFTTTRGLYVTGVLQAEDAAITGEPKRALAKVIAHNLLVERHVGRPLCDTTHCQAFLGTPLGQTPPDLDGFAAWLDALGWLPFSRGGGEPWAMTVPFSAVQAALGYAPQALAFTAGEVSYAIFQDEVEIWQSIGCEHLRGPLKLPSCPKSGRIQGKSVVFSGVGRGHGLGLDVEAAKAAIADAATLLERAYR